MGKRDDAAYKYLSKPKYFADLFNAKYFEGRQVIDSNKLLEADGRSPVAGGSAGFRDIKKRLPDGTGFVIVAIENQEIMDFEMPWRIMQYDCAEYGRQIREIHAQKANAAKESKKKISWIEEKMGEQDRLYPTFTICFYHGKEPWTGPKSLKDMMFFGENEAEWSKIFSDYHMLLVCADDPALAEKCTTQLGLLLRVLAARNDKEKMKQLKNDEKFKHLEVETGRAIAVLADMPELITQEDRKEEADMCVAIEEMIAEAKEEARADMCVAIEEMIAEAKEEARAEMCVAIAEAKEEGCEEGRKDGIDKVNSLNALLISNNRLEDLKRAISDQDYQKTLFLEYGL